LSILEALLLGLLQGFSEFLPISSTAHVTVVGKLLNLVPADKPELWTSFLAVIQLGTLISILTYFGKDIYHITYEFFRDNFKLRLRYGEQGVNARLGWMIIVGTVPIIVAGLMMKEVIEGPITKNLYLIAGSLILFAIFLAIAERVADHKRDMKDLRYLR
jgi:undecaprenyl-diphosphatase